MSKWKPASAAPVHRSVIVCAEWLDGNGPFVGEGYKDWPDKGGLWRWASDEPIEPKYRVVMYMDMPKPPSPQERRLALQQ